MSHLESGRTRARVRAFLVAALCAIVALGLGAARADDLPPGASGVLLPPGSRVSTALWNQTTQADQDDYVVLVERGRTLTATLVVEGVSSLPAPVAMDILGADDRLAATATVDRRRTRLRFAADATDAYRVRVRGGGDELVSYTLAVGVTGPVGLRVKDAAPDSNGQYRFAIPARAGARITARTTWRGWQPTAAALTAPDGAYVPGGAAAIRLFPFSAALTRFRVPDGLPFGDYALTFDFDSGDPPSRVSFTARVTLPRTSPRRGRLGWEPWLGAVTPSVGVAGTAVVLTAERAEDPAFPGFFRVRIGGRQAAAEFVDPFARTSIRAVVPDGLRPGAYDVVLESTSGQVAILPGALTIVPMPVATSFEPGAVPATTGARVTVRGTGFRPGTTGIRIGGQLAPVLPVSVTPTSVTFDAPPMDPGEYAIGVVDTVTQGASDVPEATLLWAPWATIGSVTPSVVSVLGGETVSIDGFYFGPEDTLLLETAQKGVFETIGGTYRTEAHREMTAPVRPPGRYDLVIEDDQDHRTRTASLTYFSFAEVSASLGLSPGAGLDAASTALGDLDGDGDLDLVLVRRGSGAASATSQLRVLRNDGAAGLTDVTATVVPSATAIDDWRGDRVRVEDVTQDGRPDVVVATHDTEVPAAGRSRLRILVNEARSETSAPEDRVLRDRTADLFPAPRTMTYLYGSTLPNETDDWGALDLWVGDLDGSGTGVPEIVATTDRVFENQYVSCTPYCSSPYSWGYSYSFYWGGTRVFRWNAWARAGLGKYALDAARTPKKAAVNISFGSGPPGIIYPVCNAQQPCRSTFQPFTGRRLAVGPIDGDALPDIAVLSDTVPVVKGVPTSALQVLLGRVRESPPWSLILDATPAVTALGLDLRGDALAIGTHPWTDGGGALVAVARAAQGTGPALRLLRHVDDGDPAKPGTFEDLTAALVPAPSGGESWQADALAWVDVEGDGDDDLALLSSSAPAGTASGLRLLRNLGSAAAPGPLVPDVRTLVESASTAALVGDLLTIGDLDGDGFPDYLVSRGVPGGATPETRVLATER